MLNMIKCDAPGRCSCRTAAAAAGTAHKPGRAQRATDVMAARRVDAQVGGGDRDRDSTQLCLSLCSFCLGVDAVTHDSALAGHSSGTMRLAATPATSCVA
jgi:hypothetical protein